MSNATASRTIENLLEKDKENTNQETPNKKAKLYKLAGFTLAILSALFFLGMGYIFIFNMKAGVITSSSGDLVVDYRPFPLLPTIGISMVAIFLILATFTCFRRSEKAILGSSSPSDMFDKIIVGSFIVLSLLVNISGPVQAASFDAPLAPKLQEWANSKGILMTEEQAQGITKYASTQAFNGTKESGATPYSLNGEYKSISIYKSDTNKYEFSYTPSKMSK
jgi:hypothetical protein